MLPWDMVGDSAGMARVCSSGTGKQGWPGLLHIADESSKNARGCQLPLLCQNIANAQLCMECKLCMSTHSVGRQIGKGALVQQHP